jgi:hypothetical protein
MAKIWIFTSIIFFSGLIYLEFFSQISGWMPFIVVGFLVSSVLIFSESKFKFKSLIISAANYVLIGLTAVLFVHFVLNSFDIYKLDLPQIFYSLKIYRFVTLSGYFLLSLVIYFFLLAKPLSLKLKSLKTWQLFLALYIAAILVTHTLMAVGSFYRDTTLALRNINTPFADRFTSKLGGNSYYGWIWPYSKFINKYAPEDSVIMIPPQSVVWKMEGNADYLRWFIYPRKTVGFSAEGTIPDNADFALISIGECGEGDCGWPKISIPEDRIKRIILIDRSTEDETIIENSSYEPNNDKYHWGIIELRKDL